MLTSPAASTRPRAVCICLFGLCDTLQGLVTCTSIPRPRPATGGPTRSLAGPPLEFAAGFTGYRLRRRPRKKSAGDDFRSPRPSRAAPCKPLAAY